MPKVILRTFNQINKVKVDELDYDLWKKIYEFMDGKEAIVVNSVSQEGVYVLIALCDENDDKELTYMFEQDSTVGVYIDERERFDRDWDNNEYCGIDAFFILKPECVELIG